MFLGRVEKWRTVINDEIRAGNYPFPAELILSLIQYESGGKAGIVNPRSGASGLGQVMPGTLDGYNKKTGQKIPLSVMRGKSVADGIVQIRVALWVLGRYWISAFRFLTDHNKISDVPLDDLATFGDMMYAAGPGKVRKFSRKLIPATWQTWKAKYPNSNITKHARIVWDHTRAEGPTWNLQAIDTYLKTGTPGDITPWIPPVIQTSKGGFIIGLILIAIASMFLERKGKQHETN